MLGYRPEVLSANKIPLNPPVLKCDAQHFGDDIESLAEHSCCVGFWVLEDSRRITIPAGQVEFKRIP